MQNTRLNNLLGTIASRLRQFFFNPWRRISVLVISFLFGFFMGSALATTAGQTAQWDISIAAFLVIVAETSSRIFYGRTVRERQALWVESLNIFKIGLTYSLFLEAFKLGS